MKKTRFSLLVTVCGMLLLTCCRQNLTKYDENSDLWPPIEPYESGYLKVSNIHELYYDVSGNPEGKPVIVLHGGPGGSCWPGMRQWFNPQVFKIVLFDQRGAGRSRPYADIRENTTWDLVEDIEKLREHLGIGSMLIVGGSWGTTLALAYAETYPNRVTGMVLRGIFTATQAEIDHFYHGGVRLIFPDVYERLINSLPDTDQRPLPDYLFSLLTSKDSAIRERYSKEWTHYEWKISEIAVPDEIIENWLSKNSPYAFALIENYYMANHCFMEEGHLWNHLDKIQHIPCVIVNGRFDLPCPIVTAYRLHHLLPGSRLVIVENGGHGGKEIEKAMAEAIKAFK